MKAEKYNGPYMVPYSETNGLVDITRSYSTLRASESASSRNREWRQKWRLQLAVHMWSMRMDPNGHANIIIILRGGFMP